MKSKTHTFERHFKHNKPQTYLGHYVMDTVDVDANINANVNTLDVFQIKWGSTTKDLKGVTRKIILEPMRAKSSIFSQTKNKTMHQLLLTNELTD